MLSFPARGEGADWLVANAMIDLFDDLHAEVYAGLECGVPGLYR